MGGRWAPPPTVPLRCSPTRLSPLFKACAPSAYLTCSDAKLLLNPAGGNCQLRSSSYSAMGKAIKTLKSPKKAEQLSRWSMAMVNQ